MHIYILIIYLIFNGCADKLETTNNINIETSKIDNSNEIQKDKIIYLDTGGHSALIRKIITTKSGDIISASEDKSIRIWDLKTGNEKNKILGIIGDGINGMIYSLTISPDNKLIAVSGIFDNKESQKMGSIKIYSYPDLKLIKTLYSHEDVVYDLAFSNNGEYLLSGSADRTAKLWQTSNWNLIQTFKNHSQTVYGVSFVKNNIITVGHDKKIIISDIKTGKQLKEYLNYKELNYIAVSKDFIATCGFGNRILIFDHNLKLIKKIKNDSMPKGLKFSQNGEYLITGTGSELYGVNIYSTKKWKKITSFKEHDDLTVAVNFLNNKFAISGGGNKKEIYIWDLKTGKTIKKISEGSQSFLKIGIKNKKIAFGNNKYFDLSNYKINNILNKKEFNEIPKNILKNNVKMELINSSGGNYELYNAVLNIKKDKKNIAVIVRDSTNGYRHRSYGFWKDKIISGGNNGFLKIYDLNGNEFANLIGHLGEILTISVDNDILISGSTDSMIKIWNLKNLLNYKPQKIIDENLVTEIMKFEHWTREEVFENEEYIKQKGLYIYKYIPKDIEPSLSLFINKDHEWVIWSGDNYFMSSNNGHKFLKLYLNNKNEESEILKIDKSSLYYNPEHIKNIINDIFNK